MAMFAAIGGAVLQVAGTLQQGEADAKAMERSAAIDEENARRTNLVGAIEGDQVRREERATSGEAIAAAAANNAGLGGSVADLLTQNAVEREYAVLTARYNRGSEADTLYRQARDKRKGAHATRVGAVIRAGAQALSSAGSIAGDASAAGADKRAAAPTGSLTLPSPRGP